MGREGRQQEIELDRLIHTQLVCFVRIQYTNYHQYPVQSSVCPLLM